MRLTIQHTNYWWRNLWCYYRRNFDDSRCKGSGRFRCDLLLFFGPVVIVMFALFSSVVRHSDFYLWNEDLAVGIVDVASMLAKMSESIVRPTFLKFCPAHSPPAKTNRSCPTYSQTTSLWAALPQLANLMKCSNVLQAILCLALFASYLQSYVLK